MQLTRWRSASVAVAAFVLAATLAIVAVSFGQRMASAPREPAMDEDTSADGTDPEDSADARFYEAMLAVDRAFMETTPRLNATAIAPAATSTPEGTRQYAVHEKVTRVQPERPQLEASQIQFIVMSSKKLRFKAHMAHRTWCSVAGVRCLFVVDNYFGDGRGNNLEPMFKVPRVRMDTSRCCKGGSGRGFFCGAHRQETLPAQYRFLPALNHAKQLDHVRGGQVKWMVIVDDDSFVFVPNLLRLLGSFDPSVPYYFGDFHPGREVVCGGGGSVFSIAAVNTMDVGRCISAMHRTCMQSDWMLGECARRAKVQFVKHLSCWTCAAGARKWYSKIENALGSCYFMQEVDPFLDKLPLGGPTPAIIHGIDANILAETFHRLHQYNAPQQAPAQPARRRLREPSTRDGDMRPTAAAVLRAGGNASRPAALDETGESDSDRRALRPR